jgi:ribosomal protein L37AE/L43A
MATQQQTATETYRCPECGGLLVCADGSWGCTDCRHVPRHGAD